LKFLARAIRQEEEIKIEYDSKGSSQTIPICRYHHLILKRCERLHKKLCHNKGTEVE
jgi:hypothetical protein